MRKEKKLNKILGITDDGTLIMINSVFHYEKGMNEAPFFGAIYSQFCPVSQEEINDRNSLESVKDNYGWLWKESVAGGYTEKSMDDYLLELIEGEINDNGKMFVGHDNSYIHHIPEEIMKKHFPDAVTFECVGGGRMGHRKGYDKILDQELFDLVESFEFSRTPDLSVFE